jgi:hypothetical protein
MTALFIQPLACGQFRKSLERLLSCFRLFITLFLCINVDILKIKTTNKIKK